jgi:putative zinc finger/helix-turn-helix YgiT family protein
MSVCDLAISMVCLSCKSSDFEIRNLRFSPKIKNETTEVIVPCFVCKNCNSSLLDTEQMNTLRRAVSDKYRGRHGLLTSKQIVSYRELFRMSQSSFAEYLKVGLASVKRWETYFIQDISQDEHIRLKCDNEHAELNYLDIEQRSESISVFTGKRRFSLELLYALSLRIATICLIQPQHLNKIYFYSDFLHYKRYDRGITGMKYVPLKNGPCPYQHRLITHQMKTFHIACKDDTLQASNLMLPSTGFDDREEETIQEICGILKERGVEALLALALNEKAYLETDDSDFISYAYAAQLLI